MWTYEKCLEFPVKITKKDLPIAKLLYEQIGGADGELAAALRYFSQSHTMPTTESQLLLLSIATEELAHVEILYEMVKQLTDNATAKELMLNDMGTNYAAHGKGIFPSNPTGIPFSACPIGVKGNYITDLTEDMAAEAKARATYEYLMDMTNNPEVLAPLAFLREREIVHFERFGEMLINLREK